MTFGTATKPSCPVAKCLGVLQLYELRLEKQELYSPVAPGLVQPNTPKTWVRPVVLKYTDFKTKALWREREFQDFPSCLRLPLISDFFFLCENFCGDQKGHSIFSFLMKHPEVLVCIFGNGYTVLQSWFLSTICVPFFFSLSLSSQIPKKTGSNTRNIEGLNTS